MVKTHEINLNTSTFNSLSNSSSMILKDDENKIESNDYILFKQIEIVDDEIVETGLYMLIQVKDIINNHPGLKDDYIFIEFKKI